MILYMAPGSAPCRMVLLFMHAINLKPEIKMLDLSKGENLTPEYLAINPQHTVPVLMDDGFVLSESRAILGYLAEKYAPETTYYPNDPMARGVVNQRLMFDLGSLYPRMFDAYLTPIFMGETKKNEMHYTKMVDALGFLEAFMGNAQYMAGDKITIADYSLIATISTIDKIGMDWTPYPKIAAWYMKCQKEMKNYEEVNEPGAELLASMVKAAFNI